MKVEVWCGVKLEVWGESGSAWCGVKVEVWCAFDFLIH